jgi:peptidoglycan hydrolase-like protein with peptidoglycan-binding domain
MAGIGDIIGIGFRVISHRDEIMQVWDKIVPMIRGATGIYPDIKALIEKVAPGVLNERTVSSPLVRGAAAPGDPQNFSITWLQQSLNTIDDAGLEVDGDYGEATRAAVVAFQQRHSLEADGWAGAGTSAAILAELDKAG